ncbi:MAG: protein kinase [Myxococcales bacterium]|nr:protein kinase [Myxococcales bacterium]
MLELTPGSVFARDYRVLKPLAEGGMGAVYVVEQLSTGKQRALKLMHPQFVADPKSRARFEQEARIGATLDNDHVVEVVAAGIDEPTSTPWLVMELLKGQDLAAVMAERGALPPLEVATIFEQLSHALAVAHGARIVHRDLKPENIFLAAPRRRDVPFTVKLLDFGIAKIAQESRLTATQAMGSPLWMSPEQTESSTAISPATDVWALGLIAFHVLTGSYYWRAATMDEGGALMHLLREICVEPLVPVRRRADELGAAGRLPMGFEDWFHRCVAREPRLRFQHAQEALEPLVALLRASSSAPQAWQPQATPVGAATQPAPLPQRVPQALPPAPHIEGLSTSSGSAPTDAMPVVPLSAFAPAAIAAPPVSAPPLSAPPNVPATHWGQPAEVALPPTAWGPAHHAPQPSVGAAPYASPSAPPSPAWPPSGPGPFAPHAPHPAYLAPQPVSAASPTSATLFRWGCLALSLLTVLGSLTLGGVAWYLGAFDDHDAPAGPAIRPIEAPPSHVAPAAEAPPANGAGPVAITPVAPPAAPAAPAVGDGTPQSVGSTENTASGQFTLGVGTVTGDPRLVPQVNQAMQALTPSFRGCHALAPASTGLLMLSFAIDGAGRPTNVRSEGLSAPALSGCVEGVVRRMVVSPPSRATECSFPLVYSALSDDDDA